MQFPRDPKDRLILVLILLVILAFASTMFVASYKIAQKQMQQSVAAEMEKQISSIKMLNGKTPVKGVDYTDGKDGNDGRNGRDGTNGANGKDSVSTHTETTVIKEQPLVGLEGQRGADAPMQQIRLNPVTNDLETKLSNTIFWQVLIPCDKLIVTCLVTGVQP